MNTTSATLAALLLTGALAAAGQLRLPEAGLDFASDETLRQVIGSEMQARAIIPETITYGFRVLRNPSGETPRVVTVLAEQIPQEWLPHVEGVRFERLPLEQASVQWKGQCLRLLWVTADVRDDRLRVSVSEGTRCENSGITREFDRSPQGWVARADVGVVSGTGYACRCGGG